MIHRLAPPLDPAEARRLSALHTAAFAGHDRGWSAAELSDLVAGSGAVLLVGAAGFALIRTAADEAELLTLAVAPGARGRGHGQQLLEAAMAAARAAGAQTLLLEVADDNDAARALYAAAGLAERGRRRGYYARGPGATDALVLGRAL